MHSCHTALCCLGKKLRCVVEPVKHAAAQYCIAAQAMHSASTGNVLGNPEAVIVCMLQLPVWQGTSGTQSVKHSQE